MSAFSPKRLLAGLLLAAPLSLLAQETQSSRDNLRLPEDEPPLLWDGPPAGVRRVHPRPHPHPHPPHFHDDRERWPNGPPSPAVQMQREQARKYREDHNLPRSRREPGRRDPRQ